MWTGNRKRGCHKSISRCVRLIGCSLKRYHWRHHVPTLQRHTLVLHGLPKIRAISHSFMVFEHMLLIWILPLKSLLMQNNVQSFYITENEGFLFGMMLKMLEYKERKIILFYRSSRISIFQVRFIMFSFVWTTNRLEYIIVTWGDIQKKMYFVKNYINYNITNTCSTQKLFCPQPPFVVIRMSRGWLTHVTYHFE